MELFIVRHGVTAHNTRLKHQRHHTPLSLKGEAQAEALAKALLPYGITRIETSTATRALQTADIVAKVLNIPITTHEDLREEHRPSVLADYSFFHPKSLYIMSLLFMLGASTKHHSDEENPYEFRERTKQTLKRIEANASPNEKVLIITHNAITLEMVDVLKETPFIPFFRRPLAVLLELKNCTGFHAKKDTENTQTGKWKVNAFNPIHKSFPTQNRT